MYNNLPALTDNILWDNSLLNTNYSNLTEDELLQALQDYHNNIDILCNEMHTLEPSPLNLWVNKFDRLDLYRSGLLSADRVILCDELEDSFMGKMGPQMDLYLQEHSPNSMNNERKNIAEFIRFIKSNFQLIQSGFLAFARSESTLQNVARKSTLFVDNSERNFLLSVMPPAIAHLYEKNLTVSGIEWVSNEGHFRFVSEDTLPNEIILKLEGCTPGTYINAHTFMDALQDIQHRDGSFVLKIAPGIHKNLNSYENWTQGAINRTIYFHYLNLCTDLTQSGRLGASLATNCHLTGQILEQLDGKGCLSRRMLNIETPYLNNLSLEDIFHIRSDYETSFSTYLQSLRNCALEMELAQDPKHIDLLQLRFQERITDEGLADVKNKLDNWCKKSAQKMIFTSVPAVLGFLTVPNFTTLALGAATLLPGVGDILNDKKIIKHHPSYFILKTTSPKK